MIRIRSATLEHHEKYERVFGLKPHSNILSLPYPSLLAKDMKYDQSVVQKAEDKALLTQEHKIIHPVIVSHLLDKKVHSTPLRTLE